MAIVEPRLTLTMPPQVTADTGVDALTHALEAAVSIFASPYTDAFCVQAVNLILDAPAARLSPTAPTSRRAPRWPTPRRSPGWRSRTRSSASTTRSRTRSARASASPTAAPTAIFLPHVLRYNASLPSKFMPAPGYTAYVAPEKYAQIAWVLGLGGHDRGGAARAAVRARRRAARRGRDAALAGRGRHRRARSSRPRCPTSRAPPSRTRACAPTRASRWSRELVELLEAG